MKLYSKEIYDKEVFLKAAYAFTDCAYVHLDADENNYKITLIPKDDFSEEQLYFKFGNELIAQQTRKIVAGKTQHIREMIVARALSSTVVNMGTDSERVDMNYDSDSILKDWFQENEK